MARRENSVHLRITAEVQDKLKFEAERRGVTVPELVRVAVYELLREAGLQ